MCVLVEHVLGLPSGKRSISTMVPYGSMEIAWFCENSLRKEGVRLQVHPQKVLFPGKDHK